MQGDPEGGVIASPAMERFDLIPLASDDVCCD
jgi:hypothetical protein